MPTDAYFERRKSAARGTDSLAADIMRHLHSRQNIGRAIIVCDQPIVMLSACRKQWLKLSRTIQRQRAATLNADKVLKYTQTIARMQRMKFTCKASLHEPDFDVYCIGVDQAAGQALHGISIYLTTQPSQELAKSIALGILPESLIVDYEHSTDWEKYGLLSKKTLETQVDIEWTRAVAYLKVQGIEVAKLCNSQTHNIEAMDDALDVLLGVSVRFLEVANAFHHALELARPLKIKKGIRLQYDSVALLAHRVQALGPGIFSQRFLETYDEDDAYFLYDSAGNKNSKRRLADVIDRHTNARRFKLAEALLTRRNNHMRVI